MEGDFTEYMSVKQTSRRWGLSQRYIQRYCLEGRIEGAVKFSGAWAIPISAEKPADMRKTAAKAKQSNSASAAQFHTAMPLMNASYEIGKAMEYIENIRNLTDRDIALSEYYYFSGQSEKASEIAAKYLNHGDVAVQLSACWIYGYSNLSLDKMNNTKKALKTVEATLALIGEDSPPIHKALAVAIHNCTSVLLHLDMPKLLTDLTENLHILPTGLRLFVLYVMAHHAYLNKQYGACIAIAETALALEGVIYPIPTIYLHLIATVGYINIKQGEQAKNHLLEARRLAKPDGIIQPFGEHHALLGGMLEAVIKRFFPEDFSKMIDITNSFSLGWRKLHNYETGNSVTDDLTTTEYTVAMLAARDWSNKEISNHLGISINTVKMHISASLQKLGITQRKSLAQYMHK